MACRRRHAACDGSHSSPIHFKNVVMLLARSDTGNNEFFMGPRKRRHRYSSQEKWWTDSVFFVEQATGKDTCNSLMNELNFLRYLVEVATLILAKSIGLTIYRRTPRCHNDQVQAYLSISK